MKSKFPWFVVVFIVIAVLLCCICCLCFFLLIATSSSLDSSLASSYGYTEKYVEGDSESENKILVVKVEGIILNEPPEDQGIFGLFDQQGIVYGYQIKDILYKAADDTNIKAVILDVNSPGGTVTGSQAISDGVKYFQETTGRPVYGFGSGLIASGGYWALANSDEIIIDNGSLVGSIGVIGGEISQYTDVVAETDPYTGYSVSTEGGIDKILITAGEGKDLGNPFRPITQKEFDTLQAAADDYYEVFVNYVASSRNLTSDKIINEIGALLYGEIQAKENGLIDTILSRTQIYEYVTETLKLNEDYLIVKAEPGSSNSFFANVASLFPQNFKSENKSTEFCTYKIQTMAFYGSVESLCE